MKNLFAAASYSFNNFYNNLNTQGQMIFSIIIFLIVILCILLFITYVFQGIQSKVKISKIKKETKKVEKEALKKEVQVINEEAKEPLYTNEKTEIEDIQKQISGLEDDKNEIIKENVDDIDTLNEVSHRLNEKDKKNETIEKLDKEIRKTNQFLNILNELKKNLE